MKMVMKVAGRYKWGLRGDEMKQVERERKR